MVLQDAYLQCSMNIDIAELDGNGKNTSNPKLLTIKCVTCLMKKRKYRIPQLPCTDDCSIQLAERFPLPLLLIPHLQYLPMVAW